MEQKTFNLSNGLILEIKDESKKIAKDRWVVRLRALIDIPLKYIDRDDIKAELGENVIYEKRRERNFIAETEKDAVFNELTQSFVNMSLKYLAHPDFPKKFILKKYNEHKKDKARVISFKR